VAETTEFDWDGQNQQHLKSHRVSPQEFEQVIANDPVDLEYQVESGEERFKSLGVTDDGRVLIVVWTVREGRVRAVTAYPAGKSYEKLYRAKRR
jgi:hypothetical protein